jgi:MoxR-like ATPase
MDSDLLGWGEYIPSPELRLAARALLSHRNGGAAALLLTGPPGAGKTAFAEALARAISAELVVYQLHAWSDADELFVGIDVASAVAGDAGHVRQDGVLARVARIAEERDRVVLLLDEIDKASEHTEALLLDWLQSGRVPIRPGVHLRTRLDRVLVVATSNDQRPLSEALLRRFRRVEVRPLPLEVVERIVAARSGAPRGVVTLGIRAAQEVARGEGNASLSPQEISHAVREAWELATSVTEVRMVLAAWAARTPAGREAARRSALVPALWAEIKRGRDLAHWAGARQE